MRVYTAQEIFERVGGGHPGPRDFVTMREATREVKIARQVREDGLPLHMPKYDEDSGWVCWCEDEACVWNHALDSASKSGYISAVSLLLDNLEYMDGDPDAGTGITDTDLPPQPGEEAGDEAVPAVRGKGVPVAPPENQEGGR